MGVAPLRNPPVDAAGGILVFRYKTCEALVSFQRLHINSFDPSTGAYAAALFGTNPTEANVTATATAWLALVRALYDPAWEIRWTGLYHAETVGAGGGPGAGGTSMVRYPVPTDLTGPGTGAAATTGAQYWTRTQLEFHTQADPVSVPPVAASVEPIIFEGLGGTVIGSEDFVSSNAGGTAGLQAIVGYLQGTATRIVGHNGMPIFKTGSVHLTTDVVRRRRRKSVRI